MPYEVATYDSVPLGFTMWGYKAYLDSRYLEYSRLHDWLYTPYGKLINATQEEADDALYEELATQSVADAIVVANACRAGGALYFGSSQVGYFGEQGDTFANNMGLAPLATTSNGGSAVATKIVMLFQQTTLPSPPEASVNYAAPIRTAGWSESYAGPDNIQTVIDILTKSQSFGVAGALQARASILCNSASIIGVRLYKGGAGKGQLLNYAINGFNGLGGQPGDSVQVSATSNTTGQSRRWQLRGQTDRDLVGGEWDPDDDTVQRFKNYFTSIAQLGWMAQTNTSQATIFDVTPGGLVTAEAAVPYAIGNLITVKNTTIVDTSKRIGGRFRVSAIGPGNGQFTLADWPDVYTQGGTVSIVGREFQTFSGSTLSVVRATFRKVGRPFAGYRGRRSRRPATA